jgi:hypothetical protein
VHDSDVEVTGYGSVPPLVRLVAQNLFPGYWLKPAVVLAKMRDLRLQFLAGLGSTPLHLLFIALGIFFQPPRGTFFSLYILCNVKFTLPRSFFQ